MQASATSTAVGCTPAVCRAKTSDERMSGSSESTTRSVSHLLGTIKTADPFGHASVYVACSAAEARNYVLWAKRHWRGNTHSRPLVHVQSGEAAYAHPTSLAFGKRRPSATVRTSLT